MKDSYNSISIEDIKTLDDLIMVVADTKGVKTPTFTDLRKNRTPIISQIFEDGGLWVYDNGFAAYQMGRRTTVLRIARAGTHTYEFVDADVNCSLNDQPWATALVIYGEARIEQNTREWNERRHVAFDGFDDEDDDCDDIEPLQITSSDNVEDFVINKLDNSVKRMLDCLTPRQRAVFVMYHFMDMTQQTIADKLNMDRRTIGHYIENATKKLEKKF